MPTELKTTTTVEGDNLSTVVERITGQQALEVLRNLHRQCIVEVGIAHVPTKVWNLENLDITGRNALFYEWEDTVSGWDELAAKTLLEAPQGLTCFIVNAQATAEVILHAKVIVMKNYYSANMSYLIPRYSELGQDQELVIIIHGYYVTPGQFEKVRSDLEAKGYPDIFFEELDNRQHSLVGVTGLETGEDSDNQLHVYRIKGIGPQS